MHHPATPTGHVVLDALTHPLLTRPELVVAYLALHACQSEAGALDLDAARRAATRTLDHTAWSAALAVLTKGNLLYVQGLEPRLAPLVTQSPFQRAWGAFNRVTPSLRGKTIAAYRAEVAKALESVGFTVMVDERVPAGAKKTVPVHALATAGGERLAVVCCSAKAIESNAKKLQAADVEHAYLLVHPSNELVDIHTVEVAEEGPAFDPEAVELPKNVPVEAWRKWVAYRRERKKPLTRQSVKQHLQVLVDAGPAATDVIMTSINSSWSGLFPPRRQANVPVPRGTQAPKAPRFNSGDLVEVLLGDGRTKVVTAEVVSSHYVIDETGATHPLENVQPHEPLRRAS